MSRSRTELGECRDFPLRKITTIQEHKIPNGCMDRLSDYDYELPPELIAQNPPPRRDQARLLVVRRETGNIAHRSISDLPEFLRSGDCLVFNDTRVVKARLFGVRESTGGKWEGLFLSADDTGRWQLIGQTRGRLQPGERIVLRTPDATDTATLALTLVERDTEGIWTAEPDADASVWEALDQFGTVPLPPYIERNAEEPEDTERYQTVYASHPGAVAAPTAGLHFTPELLDRLREHGVETAFVTLHVGIGTFRPISVENLSDHRMHTEWCRVTSETAELLNRVRSNGGRIVAVGTTSVRTLESVYTDGRFQPTQTETRLFIRPPYRFRAIDALLTNFHLPKSSLLVMISALLGVQRTQDAYAEAIRERYRFFSYGDAMLIL